MKRRKRPAQELTFQAACRLLHSVLDGDRRQEILAWARETGSFRRALTRLREAMRTHVFHARAGTIRLGTVVERFDRLTRRDGFHVLNDWDGKADTFNENTIPVDVLDFLIERRIPEGSGETVLGILLDYYFFYVLALLSLRVWDEGDANDNVDRLSELVRKLQGPGGSGQSFVSNAETLVLVATSHFESDLSAYDRLLERVKRWNSLHQRELALAHAAILASHLRFGFEATYGRDLVAMRNDNVPDYPWLCFALLTLITAYDQLETGGVERQKVVEGLLNGLSPDPRAFFGKPPPSLSVHTRELRALQALFAKHRKDLLTEFERMRPAENDYSPLSFFFNFPHNLLKAMVVDALLCGKPCRVSLNDLLTGIPSSGEKKALVATLMGYARKSPDQIRGRLVPVIVYDPRSGRRAFADTMRKLF